MKNSWNPAIIGERLSIVEGSISALEAGKVKQTDIDDTGWHTIVLSPSDNQTTETGGLEKCRGLRAIANPRGTTTSDGQLILSLGNNLESGTDGNYKGRIRLYGAGVNYTDIVTGTISSNQTLELPKANGTLALKSELLPECDKTTDGTYTLTCTVSGGVKTYSWS